MIGIALILGAVIVGTTLIARYWSRIVDFMKKVFYKLKSKINGVLMGSCVFIKKLGDRFQNRTKHYSKNELGKWKETIVTYEQEEDEVPEKYRNYATLEDEFDLTPELELQLQQA